VSGKSSPGSHDPQLWTGISTTDRNKYPDFTRASCLGTLCSILFTGTNYLTSKWIAEQDSRPRLGITVTDFPGGRLVDRIIRNNDPEMDSVEIFENSSYRGKMASFSQDTPSFGDMNDKMSSFKIPQGWTVRFYQHENYGGNYYTRDANSDDAWFARDMNDKISSMKILSRG